MQLDLNLLAALDALLEEGSVGAAADRMRVTAPAMSRTLGRIRRATGDQILVRTGRTMIPTPYAESVREHVHALVQQAHAVLSPPRELDLAALERTFTLRWQDTLVELCGPRLLAAVHAEAPGVRLRFLAENATDSPELRRGEVDLECNATEPTAPDVRHVRVADGRLVFAVRAGHPLTRGELTPARYATETDHIVVSRRGRMQDPVDSLLATLNLGRRVVASVPAAATALLFVRHSEDDLAVTVPEPTAHIAASEYGLAVLPLPVALPAIPLHLSWHQRHDDDRAHAWLRAKAREVLGELDATRT
ncbi:LysR family transcriptional regulator [Actinospica robiniae]|uniref:LysR family transcriptional regulator n=1 Tax=Actinospica robiniae TaxID=304901 RepID=UPI00055472C8|nr:LysR family transcriptional regulator [Actinospica robiniae]